MTAPSFRRKSMANWLCESWYGFREILNMIWCRRRAIYLFTLWLWTKCIIVVSIPQRICLPENLNWNWLSGSEPRSKQNRYTTGWHINQINSQHKVSRCLGCSTLIMKWKRITTAGLVHSTLEFVSLLCTIAFPWPNFFIKQIFGSSACPRDKLCTEVKNVVGYLHGVSNGEKLDWLFYIEWLSN